MTCVFTYYLENNFSAMLLRWNIVHVVYTSHLCVLIIFFDKTTVWLRYCNIPIGINSSSELRGFSKVHNRLGSADIGSVLLNDKHEHAVIKV